MPTDNKALAKHNESKLPTPNKLFILSISSGQCGAKFVVCYRFLPPVTLCVGTFYRLGNAFHKNQAIGNAQKCEWNRERVEIWKTAGQSTEFVACPSPRFSSPFPSAPSTIFPLHFTSLHSAHKHTHANVTRQKIGWKVFFAPDPFTLCWYINFPVKWKSFSRSLFN